ncbi:MAG: winged helix-turn-helix transcriptional regulator [Eubacterium sp.]|nr:winged helix-turn-helix transcriptional regulator [Eubacterium sp.]
MLLYLLLLSIYQHEYILTDLGASLQPVLDSMVKWGIS